MKIRKIIEKIEPEITEQYCEQMFMELLAFQGYGFNFSHSLAYSVLTAWQLYLKANYFPEFMCTLIRHTPRAKEKHGHSLLEARVKYAAKHGLRILPPDINRSESLWVLEDEHTLRIGLGDLYGVGKAGEEIVKNQPYKSVQNFLDKMSSGLINKMRFETLLFSGCFDGFGNKSDIYNWYFNDYLNNKNRSANLENQMSFDLDIEMNKSNSYVPIFFSKKELSDREEKAIGFNLDFNFLNRYRDIMEKNQLKTISDVYLGKVKYPRIICKVIGLSNYLKRDGRKGVKINLSDGYESSCLYMDIDTYDVRKHYFEEDNILVVSVVVNDENRRIYSLNKKEDIKKLN